MVTLTGTFTRLDGTPATGTVRVTPSRSPILDPDGKIVISGPQVFPLDKDGKLTVQIPASNDPDLGPAFTYAVDVNLTHASWKISKVWIPHGSTTVDLSEIGDYQPVPGVATRTVTIPADGTDGQVLVWDGAGFSWEFPPPGPQGPSGEVTTAELTAALAGKVTGTGMTLRRDTTVGTRVLLDHPGGTTMLYGDTGWRDVSAYLHDHIVPGTFGARLRIEGTTAHLLIRGATIGTDRVGLPLSNVVAIFNFPPGTAPAQLFTLALGTIKHAQYSGALQSLASANRLDGFFPPDTGNWPENGDVNVYASWQVATWPTTLPGTPA